MGKLIPWSFEKIRSGEQIQPPTFTNVAGAVAAGVTAQEIAQRVQRAQQQRTSGQAVAA
jgi:hypothetical protein